MESFSQLSLPIQVSFISLCALIMGSFASLLSYRLAHKLPIVFTRSKCTKCRAPLKFYNLIPLFSWLFQGGKCSKCKVRISLRYPLIELTFVAAFLTVFFVLERQLDAKMILYFLIATTLIIMCVIDLEEYFIPDSTQYFLTILACFVVLQQGGNAAIFAHVKAAFVYLGFGLALYAFFKFTTTLEAIGIDDLKFFFISGFLLGLNDFLGFMFLSGVLGVIFGSLWQKIMKDETFPFAPSICVATFICLLFDKKINMVDVLGSMLFLQDF